jgi:hypothetical protein
MERRGMSWCRGGVVVAGWSFGAWGVGSEPSSRCFPASPTNQNKVGGNHNRYRPTEPFLCGLCGCGRGFSPVTHGSPLCGSGNRVYALDTSRISEQHAHRTNPYQVPVVGVPARR